jgi:hypothetical protein
LLFSTWYRIDNGIRDFSCQHHFFDDGIYLNHVNYPAFCSS